MCIYIHIHIYTYIVHKHYDSYLLIDGDRELYYSIYALNMENYDDP